MTAHVRLTPRRARELEELRALLGELLEGGKPLSASDAIRWAVRRAYRSLTRRKRKEV